MEYEKEPTNPSIEVPAERNRKRLRFPLKFFVTIVIFTFIFIFPQLQRNASLAHEFPVFFEYDETSDRNDVDSSKDGFSTCLLIMDDNHMLVEWLAYHHYVLPLQHLIITVDPRSVTTPKPILDRWRNYGMIIDEWSAENFTSQRSSLRKFNITQKHSSKELVGIHRQRQNEFYGSCLRHFRELNKTWVLLIDTDEYIHYNGPNGAINDNGYNNDSIPVIYRSVKEYGTVFNFLKDHQQNAAQQQKQNGGNTTNSTERISFPKCISIPRLTFGNHETPNDPKQKIIQSKTNEFNTSMLNTIRFRKHGKRDNFEHQKWNKNIIDVSQYKNNEIPLKTRNVHAPLRDCMRWVDDRYAIFRVNHYFGTWEAYSFRGNDPRWDYDKKSRSRATYLKNGNLDAGEDDSIRDWMNGFVEYHGKDEALQLLDGAGIVPNISKSIN